MKLYLECNMGAAGDMLMAALLELLPDRQAFLDQMNGLGIPGVHIHLEESVKCGIRGSHIRVHVHGAEEASEDVPIGDAAAGESHAHEHGHEHEHTYDYEHEHTHEHDHDHDHEHEHHHNSSHSHTGYEDICALIGALNLPEQVKKDAAAVYRLIGEAEAQVHGVSMDQLHFHEVGTLDAVADVVGCCLLMHMLAPAEVSASPVHVGSGFVRCAHGVLPVPAPATALILRGVPIYGGKIKGELCTPTGAALLRHFVMRFGDMPPMAVSKIGYGMGSKDFEAANCVRAFWGTDGGGRDDIVEITCNLDDMTPEAIGFAVDRLFEAGALDVFTAPIYMKKNRPAVLLSCLCKPEDREKLADLTLLHTTTQGVRFYPCGRKVLDYAFQTVSTPYGDIRVKTASGHGVKKTKPEYEDVSRAARASGVPFTQVYQQAVHAIKKENL